MSHRRLERTLSAAVPVIIFLILLFVYWQETRTEPKVATLPPTATLQLVAAPPSATAPAVAALPSDTAPAPVTPTVAKPAAVSPTASASRSPTPPGSRTAGATTRQALIPPPTSAKFNFYLLALSWAPEFCVQSNNQDPQECAFGKRYGFVLHGLWPQYDQGYPQNCSTHRLPADIKAAFPGLFPTSALYDHEWEKHGTCSGLSPAQYFDWAKRLKESVVIPAVYRAPETQLRVSLDQFKNDFTGANPGMPAAALAPQCSDSGRYLSELQVCVTQMGTPLVCSSEVRNDSARSCRNADITIRPVR